MLGNKLWFIKRKNLKMNFLKNFYNKKSKEEKSTTPLKISVKVEICWRNKQCDL